MASRHRSHRRLSVHRRLRLPENLELRRVLNGTCELAQPAADEIVELGAKVAAAPELRTAVAEAELTVTLPANDRSRAGVYESFQSAEQLEKRLLDQALSRWQGTFGQPAWNGWYPWILDGLPAGGYALRDTMVASDGFDFQTMSIPESMVSDTNVQVAGVDEADIVETDGQFLYVLAHGKLSVIDVRVPDEMELVATVSTDGFGAAMYLHGTRLTLISTAYRETSVTDPISLEARPFDLVRRAEPIVRLTVLDVSDPANPAVSQSIELEGNLIQSRAIGDKVHLVLANYGLLPAPLTVPADPSAAKSSGNVSNSQTSGAADRMFYVPIDGRPGGFPVDSKYRYETREEYIARLSGKLLKTVLPQYRAQVAGTDGVQTGPLASAETIFAKSDEVEDQLISVVVIDVNDTENPGPESSASVLGGSANQVYASADNLYVLRSRWDGLGETTEILQFDIGDATSVTLAASGSVPGHVLNQFSIDEYNGYLRVATSDGWWVDSHSDVYVLSAQEGQLAPVGKVENLAPGEAIFAVRFAGDRAYVVTFQRIDPLFVLDLSDPANPVVQGELKIPGFSNYLHPVADDFLLGLGRDADVNTGIGLAPAVSLFNVHDPLLPIQIDSDIIEAHAGGWSLALSDHHAASYFASEGILAIPFQSTRYEMDAAGMPMPEDRLASGDQLADDEQLRPMILDWFPMPRVVVQNELWVFRIDVTASGEGAIELAGVIDHASAVQRSVLVGDVLISIADSDVQAYSLDDLTAPIATVFVGALTQPDHFRLIGDLTDIPLRVLGNDPGAVSGPLKIVSITDPAEGGAATISEDGRTILYTPPSDTSIRGDRFSYTVESASGRREESSVSLSIDRFLSKEQLITKAKETLAERLNVPVDEIDLLRYERTNRPATCSSDPFSDWCLPNDAIAARIILAHADTRYELEATVDGTVRFVEQNQPPSALPVDDVVRVEAGQREVRIDVLANDFPGVSFIRAPLITQVTPIVAQGTLEIADGGQFLVYTPPEDFVGRETFNYTVDNHHTAKVTIVVEPPTSADDVVTIRLEATDPEGNPIIGVTTGEEFVVNIFVSEQIEGASGVFATYLNLSYDSGLVRLAGEPEFSSAYPNGRTFDLTSVATVRDLGAFASMTPLGDEEVLFASLHFRAVGTGTLEMATGPASPVPGHEILAFNLNEPIGSTQVAYGGLGLPAVESWQNPVEPRDVTGDGHIAPSDALDLIDDINANGARRLAHELRRQAVSAMDATTPQTLRFRDPNGDGFCSPDDVLQIIDYLNELSRIRGAVGESLLEPIPVAAARAPALEAAAVASSIDEPIVSPPPLPAAGTVESNPIANDVALATLEIGPNLDLLPPRPAAGIRPLAAVPATERLAALDEVLAGVDADVLATRVANPVRRLRLAR